MLVVNVDERLSAKQVLEHPWMKLPIATSAENSQCDEEISTNHIDADISSNLEALRQHNATRKFNLAAMVLGGISSIRSNMTSRSSLMSSPPQVSHKARRASDPALLARSIANDAKQAEKLARLSAAIASHNHSANQNQIETKTIREQRRHSVL